MTFDAVLIAGPTASGKTRAALAIAEAIGGVIVNADSMQVYRELSALTARPGAAEIARVPHLLFGHVSVREPYSVGRYASDAAGAFAGAVRLRRVPIFVGGTGLYFHALTVGLADMPAVPAATRNAVRARFDKIGRAAFHSELAERDPEMAAGLRTSDTQRLLRAGEILAATGRSLSAWQREAGKPVLGKSKLGKFVLEVPRDELRGRIAERFRAMLAAGALEEAVGLADLDPSLPATKVLGLRELVAAGRGDLSIEEAKARAIVRTGQFAKRQVTWFRHRMADWRRVEARDGRNFITEILGLLV